MFPNLIADALSLSIIDRELFDFYQDPGKKIQPMDHRYKECVKEIEHLEGSAVIKERQRFWEEHIQGRRMICPTDIKKGPNNIASEKAHEAAYSLKEFGIDGSSRRSGIFDYVSVGLYNHLAKWTNLKDGFARIRSQDCGHQLLLAFSCQGCRFIDQVPFPYTLSESRSFICSELLPYV